MKRLAVPWICLMLAALCSSCDAILPLLHPKVELTVVNSTGSAVSAVYARQAGEAEWGTSRILSELASGAVASFELERASYDLKAVFTGGDILEEEALDLSSYELYTLTLVDGATP